jgi:hypothetical protein
MDNLFLSPLPLFEVQRRELYGPCTYAFGKYKFTQLMSLKNILKMLEARHACFVMLRRTEKHSGKVVLCLLSYHISEFQKLLITNQDVASVVFHKHVNYQLEIINILEYKK